MAAYVLVHGGATGCRLNAASVPPEGGNGFDRMRPRHRELCQQALAAAEAGGTTTTPVPEQRH